MKNHLRSVVLALALLTLISITGHSQSFYETKFKDPKGNEYLGFMVYYNENYAYMRVAFSQGNRYNVVNVEYTSLTGNEEGMSYLFLLGSNATYVTENAYYTYNPEHFIWMWDDETTMEKPFYTTDPDFNEENIYEVDYFNELALTDLSEEYLQQFFSTAEEDYIAIINALNTDYDDEIEYYYTESKDRTMHLFVVANTAVGDIGQSCEIDKRNFISEFEGVGEALGINVETYVVEDDNYSKSTVLSTLDRIQPDDDDIILFFYTGHGFRWNDQTDRYPYLDLRENSYQPINDQTSMSFSSLYQSLVAKGARLTVVLSNCCNSNVGINQMTSSTFLVTMSNQNYELENLSKLLLESSGSVLATAASPNEYAWCNTANGGFFTNSFLQAFRQEISVLNNDEVDWDGILQNAIASTRQKTSPASCPSCEVQNGQMFTKVTTN